MKVLHVTPSIARAYGGPTYSLAGYARAAILDGVDVTVAAPAATQGDKWLAQTVPEATVYAFRTYGRGAFLASADLHSWVRRNAAQFDVVHVHGLFNPISSLAARACIRHGWPLVIRPFGTLSRYTANHRRGALKQLYRYLIDLPNLYSASVVHFTTTTEEAESAWQRIEWGDRAFVIPPPWIDDQERPASRPLTKTPTVLFLSRLHPVKNLELLLDAWPEILSYVPDATLVIAGDGDVSYVNTLRGRAAALGATVTFTGFVEGEAKRQLLESAAIFVLPSLHENFGIAVLEALSAGLPAVVTPEVQLSTFVRDNSLGVVSECSVSALATAVVQAVGDRVLRERCRKLGHSLVARNFSPQFVGAMLRDMYGFASAHPPSRV